jgi:hypothetical protein
MLYAPGMSIKAQATSVFSDTSRWAAAQAKTIALREALAGKFDFSGVLDNSWLRLVGQHFAASYTGDFAYMVEMREIALGERGLSAGQTAGVLNCAIAEWTRKDRFAQNTRRQDDLPNVASVPSSRYRVVQPDGKSLAVRLGDAKWATDKAEGTRALYYLGQGADWTFVGFVSPEGTVTLKRDAYNMRASLKAALDVLVNSVREDRWLVHALAYSLEGSECCFCGRDLDTAESISVGYGPVCAAKYGLPWGEKAEPASVVLARDALIGGGIAPAAVEEDQVPMYRTAPESTSEPTTVAQTNDFGQPSNEKVWNHDSPLGTFESGRKILKNAGKEPSLDKTYGPSSYRPGRSYEEIFGSED